MLAGKMGDYISQSMLSNKSIRSCSDTEPESAIFMVDIGNI
jgi:hypothetical protein